MVSAQALDYKFNLENVTIPIDLLELIVPTVLTIIGWLVAAYWAVKQVNLAHDKNIRLQQAILTQSNREILARSFIALYLDTARSMAVFKSLLGKVATNMSLDEDRLRGIDGGHNRGHLSNIVFGWRQTIDDVNTAYSELCVHFEHLRLWLEVHREHIPNSDKVSHIIDEFESAFIHKAGNMDDLWLGFQATIAAIQIRNKPDTKLYEAASKPLQLKIDHVLTDLKVEVRAVEKHLLGGERILFQ